VRLSLELIVGGVQSPEPKFIFQPDGAAWFGVLESHSKDRSPHAPPSTLADDRFPLVTRYTSQPSRSSTYQMMTSSRSVRSFAAGSGIEKVC
jgi:hypothetical protein